MTTHRAGRLGTPVGAPLIAVLALATALASCSSAGEAQSAPAEVASTTTEPPATTSTSTTSTSATSTGTAPPADDTADDAVPTRLVFAAPGGYGGSEGTAWPGPVDEESVIPVVREPGIDMALFVADTSEETASGGSGAPTSVGDLMITVVPRAAIAAMDELSLPTIAIPGLDSTGYRSTFYEGHGFQGELGWYDGDRAFLASSRTFTTDELVDLAPAVRYAGERIRLEPDAGLEEASHGRFFHRFGPIRDSRAVIGLHESTWTTGGQGRPGQLGPSSIRVYGRELDPLDLAFVEYLGQNVEQVEVRGSPAVLAEFPSQHPHWLAWVEDGETLMMLSTSDPGVDLVAMAETGVQRPVRPIDAYPPPGWDDPEATQVASGIDLGREWRVWSSPNPTYSYSLCGQSRLNGEEWPESFSCEVGSGLFDLLQGFGGFGGIPAGGERWGLLVGRVPDCAARVTATPPSVSRPVEAETFEASDGLRYFVLAMPFPPIQTGDAPPATSVWVEAVDEDGRVIDDTSSGAWTVHC